MRLFATMLASALISPTLSFGDIAIKKWTCEEVILDVLKNIGGQFCLDCNRSDVLEALSQVPREKVTAVFYFFEYGVRAPDFLNRIATIAEESQVLMAKEGSSQHPFEYIQQGEGAIKGRDIQREISIVTIQGDKEQLFQFAKKLFFTDGTSPKGLIVYHDAPELLPWPSPQSRSTFVNYEFIRRPEGHPYTIAALETLISINMNKRIIGGPLEMAHLEHLSKGVRDPGMSKYLASILNSTPYQFNLDSASVGYDAENSKSYLKFLSVASALRKVYPFQRPHIESPTPQPNVLGKRSQFVAAITQKWPSSHLALLEQVQFNPEVQNEWGVVDFYNQDRALDKIAKVVGNIARSDRQYMAAKELLGSSIELSGIPDLLRVASSGSGEDQFFIYFARLDGKLIILELGLGTKDRSVIRQQITKAIRRLNYR